MSGSCISLLPEDRGHLVVTSGTHFVITYITDSHLSLQPNALNCTAGTLCHPAALPPPYPNAVTSVQQAVTVSSALTNLPYHGFSNGLSSQSSNWFYNNSMLRQEVTSIQTELKTLGPRSI